MTTALQNLSIQFENISMARDILEKIEGNERIDQLAEQMNSEASTIAKALELTIQNVRKDAIANGLVLSSTRVMFSEQVIDFLDYADDMVKNLDMAPAGYVYDLDGEELEMDLSEVAEMNTLLGVWEYLGVRKELDS